MELVRFTSYVTLDEERKARKFEEGLHPRGYNGVYSHNLKTLTKVIGREVIVERVLLRITTYYDQHKR